MALRHRRASSEIIIFFFFFFPTATILDAGSIIDGTGSTGSTMQYHLAQGGSHLGLDGDRIKGLQQEVTGNTGPIAARQSAWVLMVVSIAPGGYGVGLVAGQNSVIVSLSIGFVVFLLQL